MYQTPTNGELIIANNNVSIKNDTHSFVDYKNKICIKPWGHEFLIYMNEKIGIWFLKINKGCQTSLHTHFNKDTLLIAYKGTGKINLIDNKSIILNEMECIYLPKYKFHGLSSFSDCTYFMEIEIYDKNITFTDKNDLLRIQDIYERENVGYSSSINISTDFEKFDYFYLTDNNTKIVQHDNIINYKIITTYHDIDDTNLNILIDGEIYLNGHILKEGSIITKNENMKFISDSVKIISLFSSDKIENSKIIYDMEHLNTLLHSLHNKKRILTSGCFDIIHVGHMNTLKHAKQLGDCLMVCLSSDEQIKKLKGDNRPINNYNDRINLFKTINYVDYIILYDESDIEKEKMLDQIMNLIDPDIWVKGTDYDEKTILLKHPHLKSITLIDNIPNKSTTNIITKIQNP